MGRAHVRIPVTCMKIVCGLVLAKKNMPQGNNSAVPQKSVPQAHGPVIPQQDLQKTEEDLSE